MALTATKAELILNTVQEAFSGQQPWRFVLVGATDEELAAIEDWLVRLRERGRGFALSHEQTKSDVRALNQRRVLMFIEPAEEEGDP